MSANRPSIPKGTRDFGPSEMAGRNHIFGIIRNVFESCGFRSLETPAMENLTTLLGKYGDEGDKLLFRILNSGDYLSGCKSPLDNADSTVLLPYIAEKGLRYDLTVPFARFVVQHRNEITFPFKRYQIQPVWRADRPQKGRYREFYQCDADVIGSDSLLNEAEFLYIIDQVFQKLEIRVGIRINNRKVLSGIASSLGAGNRLTDFTVALDKADKIGEEGVLRELTEKGFTSRQLESLKPLLGLQGDVLQKTAGLKSFFSESETGLKGLDEIEELCRYAKDLMLNSSLEFDLSLARGLNYYTGTIVEVKALDMEIGSICGGGRYDDLTGIFGLPGVSGVGISFGADRIYDVMEHLKLFPPETASSVKIMFVNFGKSLSSSLSPIISNLRNSGVPVLLYPDSVKLGKQFEYANKMNIPFVAIAGEEEMKNGELSIKNMNTGEQETIKFSFLPEFLMK